MECRHEGIRRLVTGGFRCNVCNEYITEEEAVESKLDIDMCRITISENDNFTDSIKDENIALKHNIDSLLLEKYELINNLERVEAYMRDIEINSDLTSKENEELKRTIKTICKVLGE